MALDKRIAAQVLDLHLICSKRRSTAASRRGLSIVHCVEASFAKGLLKITLPKTPEAQQPPKKIEIKAA